MFKQAMIEGLWKQNPGVIQLLGLCPTLAVTTTVVNGVSLGLATVFVMIFSNASISPIRKFIPNEIRVPVFILVIAALVGTTGLGQLIYIGLSKADFGTGMISGVSIALIAIIFDRTTQAWRIKLEKKTQ